MRHLHLIDLENLGVDEPGGPVTAGTGAIYRNVTDPAEFDQFIVGADATRIFDVLREFPGALHCAGRGPDGGERSIINHVDLDRAVQRFDAITIASGDGYFTDLAAHARQRGLWLRVISRPGRTSHKLRTLADHFIAFPSPAQRQGRPGDAVGTRSAA